MRRTGSRLTMATNGLRASSTRPCLGGLVGKQGSTALQSASRPRPDVKRLSLQLRRRPPGSLGFSAHNCLIDRPLLFCAPDVACVGAPEQSVRRHGSETDTRQRRGRRRCSVTRRVVRDRRSTQAVPLPEIGRSYLPGIYSGAATWVVNSTSGTRRSRHRQLRRGSRVNLSLSRHHRGVCLRGAVSAACRRPPRCQARRKVRGTPANSTVKSAGEPRVHRWRRGLRTIRRLRADHSVSRASVEVWAPSRARVSSSA